MLYAKIYPMVLIYGKRLSNPQGHDAAGGISRVEKMQCRIQTQPSGLWHSASTKEAAGNYFTFVMRKLTLQLLKSHV
jgi:hypothetical protein